MKRVLTLKKNLVFTDEESLHLTYTNSKKKGFKKSNFFLFFFEIFL